MGIEMPAEVRWLLPIVVGDSWPEGDETALQRLAEVWKQAATDVDDAMREAEDAVKQATSNMDGEAAEAFKAYWAKFVKGEEATLPKMKDVSEKLATACRNCAMQIEYAKLSIIIALVILAIQIAAMLASAVVSFGASTAGIVPAQLATRAGVQIVFRQLVQQLMQQVGRNLIGKLALQVGIEVATSVATDLAVQGIQLAKGTRDSLDTSMTLDAAKSGLISGVVGAGVGAGMGKALGDGVGDSLGRSIGRNAAEEAVIGAGSALAEGALSEEGIQAKDVLFGATSGAVSGSVTGMKSGIEGLNADLDVPTAGDMPRPSSDMPSPPPRPDAAPRVDGPPGPPAEAEPPRRSADATNTSYAAPPTEQPAHRAAPDSPPPAQPSQQPQGLSQSSAPPSNAPANAPAAPRAAMPAAPPMGGPSPSHGGNASHAPSAAPSHTSPTSNAGSAASGGHSTSNAPSPAHGSTSPGGPQAGGGPTHGSAPTAGPPHAGHTPATGSQVPSGHAPGSHAHGPGGGPNHSPAPHPASAQGLGNSLTGTHHSPAPNAPGPAGPHHSPVPHPASNGPGPAGVHHAPPAQRPGDVVHQANTSAPFTAQSPVVPPPSRGNTEPAPAQQAPAPAHAPVQQHHAPPRQAPGRHQQPPASQHQPRPPAQQRQAPPRQHPHQGPPAQHRAAPLPPPAQQHAPVQRTPAQQHLPGQHTPAQQHLPGQHTPAQQHLPGQHPPATGLPRPVTTGDAPTPHERQARTPWEERKRLNTPVPLPDNLKHLQNDVKHTKAGLSLHDNNFRAHSHSAAMVVPDPRRYTVDLHGSADDVRVGDTKLSPKDLADIIRSSGDWDGRQPVRLISCQTGTKADGFAAQLSRELGVDVVSPTKDAWVDDMGNVFASSTHFDPTRGDFSPGWPPNGDWVTFRPDGSSSKHDRPTPPGSAPTWGDVLPEDRPRAWRRGEDGTWVADADDNWHFVPARNSPPPHPVRGGEQPQWTPNQPPPNHTPQNPGQPNPGQQFHRQGPPPGFPPPGRAPQRPVQGPPPGRLPQGGHPNPNPVRHDPRQQQQRMPQPDQRRFPQQQPGGFGPRGFDPNQQQHRQGPPPNQAHDPRQASGFVPHHDQRRPVPPPGPEGRPQPPRPMQPPPQSFGPDPRHAAPEHRPQQQQPNHVDAPPQQHQPPVAEQPKELQRTPDGIEWVPLEEQLTATRDRPITPTELALREKALELYAKKKGFYFGYDRASLKSEVSKYKVGLDGKFIEVPYVPPPPPQRPDRLTPEYLKDLAKHVSTHGQPATPAHTFTPKSDELPPGRTAQIPPGAYANTVVPVHPAQLHFNTSGNGDRLIHRNEPDFLNKENALFRRMSYNISGVENGAGIAPKGTSGNAEAHINGNTNGIYVSFTDSLEHVIGRPPSAMPPRGHGDGYVMVDYVVEAYHPNGIDSDASFHDAGVASPHRENEYLFAGGMPDENIFRIWKLEVTLDESGNPSETKVVGSRVNHRFKYLSQMGIR